MYRTILAAAAFAASASAQPPVDNGASTGARTPPGITAAPSPAADPPPVVSPAPMVGDQAGPPIATLPAADTTAPAAPPPPDPFALFITGLRPRAFAAGVSPATFDRETAGLTFNDRVVRLDRAQPGGAASGPLGEMNFAPYRIQHVDRAHIVKGRERYAALGPLLAGIAQRTGVASPIAMSIFGHETGYGSYTGSFDLLRSLGSLAYEGRRRALFADEFIAALQLIERGVPRAELKGSWAGATGFPQFLPSVYLRIAIDGDNDGRADIWASEADALASIGAYLTEAGWKPATPWGVAVRVPASFDRASIRSPLTSPRCPRVHARLSRWLSVGEWKALGIAIAGYPAPADSEQARLIEPDGPDATAYLVTTNYDAILDYNCSNFYALAVGLLADEIAR